MFANARSVIEVLKTSKGFFRNTAKNMILGIVSTEMTSIERKLVFVAVCRVCVKSTINLAVKSSKNLIVYTNRSRHLQLVGRYIDSVEDLFKSRSNFRYNFC